MIRSKLYTWILSVCTMIMLSQTAFGKDYAVRDSLTFPAVSGFKIVYNYPVYYPDNLWDLIDGAADAFVAYGFVNLHIAEYVQGDLHIKVEVYRHKNTVLAFGIYAAERSSDYRFVPLGIQGYAENSLVFFVKGPFYVKITSYEENEQTGAWLMKIAKAVESNLFGETNFPEAFGKFPVKNQKKNTGHFIPDNFLGYSFLSGAYTMDYSYGDKSFTAFLIQSDDKQGIVEMLKKLKEKAVSSEQISGRIIRVEDKYNGNLFLLANGNQLMGAMGQADQNVLIRFLTDFNRAFK